MSMDIDHGQNAMTVELGSLHEAYVAAKNIPVHQNFPSLFYRSMETVLTIAEDQYPFMAANITSQRDTWRLAWLLYHDDNAAAIDKSTKSRVANSPCETTENFLDYMCDVPHLRHLRRVIYWLESVAADGRFNEIMDTVEDSRGAAKWEIKSSDVDEVNRNGTRQSGGEGKKQSVSECLMKYVWCNLRMGKVFEAQQECRLHFQQFRAAMLAPSTDLFSIPSGLFSHEIPWDAEHTFTDMAGIPPTAPMRRELYLLHLRAFTALEAECQGSLRPFEAAVCSVVSGDKREGPVMSQTYAWHDSLWRIFRQILRKDLISTMEGRPTSINSMIEQMPMPAEDKFEFHIQRLLIARDIPTLFSDLQNSCESGNLSEDQLFFGGNLAIFFRGIFAASRDEEWSLTAQGLIDAFSSALISKRTHWPFDPRTYVSVREAKLGHLGVLPSLIAVLDSNESTAKILTHFLLEHVSEDDSGALLELTQNNIPPPQILDALTRALKQIRDRVGQVSVENIINVLDLVLANQDWLWISNFLQEGLLLLEVLVLRQEREKAFDIVKYLSDYISEYLSKNSAHTLHEEDLRKLQVWKSWMNVLFEVADLRKRPVPAAHGKEPSDLKFSSIYMRDGTAVLNTIESFLTLRRHWKIYPQMAQSLSLTVEELSHVHVEISDRIIQLLPLPHDNRDPTFLAAAQRLIGIADIVASETDKIYDDFHPPAKLQNLLTKISTAANSANFL